MKARFWQWLAMLASGVVLLQAGGCAVDPFFNFLQTVFLGVITGGVIWIVQKA